MKPPPACGTFLTSDGSDMLLGPYSDQRSLDSFKCNTGEGAWFAHTYYAPSYMYGFMLTQRCEYMFRTPEGDLEWQETRDVNSWFEQAAKTLQRPDNVGYKVSDNNIIFSGLAVPNYLTDLVNNDIPECPEKYCVKVKGSAIIRKGQSDGEVGIDVSPPEILYAFSNKNAYDDFYKMMRDAMRSSNREHIFLTNHFLRCGCESFCMDHPETTGAVSYGATCYAEAVCGTRVFQIAYSDDYPEEKKADWSTTGTTKVTDWLNACAIATYGCAEDSGTDTWTCPTASHQSELQSFLSVVESSGLNDDGDLDKPLPDTPCAPVVIIPPQPPSPPPPVGPKCLDVDHVGYCYQMPGATCFAATASETCAEVDLVLINETSTYYYDNVADWTDACLASGVKCTKDPMYDRFQGELTFEGAPFPYPVTVSGDWMFLMGNRISNQKNTLDGYLYYSCDSWEGAFGAKNVS
jgi:hypothetical protein